MSKLLILAALALAFLVIERASGAPLQNVRLPTNFPSDYYDTTRDSCSYAKATYLCNVTSRYRTMDGSCNNIARPYMGMAGIAYKRLRVPAYADNVSLPRNTSVNGGALPNPRKLSAQLCRDNSATDKVWTNLLPLFGQFVAHDLTNLLPTLSKILAKNKNIFLVFESSCKNKKAPLAQNWIARTTRRAQAVAP